MSPDLGRRVAVTGIGVVSAIGTGAAAFWESLREGRSGIAPIRQIDIPGLKFQNGAEIPDFAWGDDRERSLYDRFALMAGCAAEEALEGLSLPRERTAVITGSCLGGNHFEDASYRELYAERRTRFNPVTIPKIMENAPASLISMKWGLAGPAYTVASACSSSNHAIGQAFWMIRAGLADAAVCGGADATFSLGILRAWEAMRVVSPDTCRPFCAGRPGMILGEGAAMLVLEPLEEARARGADIFGEIVGFGMSSDAHHITQPSGDGAERAMRAALVDASLAPEAVGYINAHGTGTQANDPVECQAIERLFGARGPAISSTKSMHGHTLGAAGAIEAVAALLALRHGTLPPTANFTTQSPDCPGDIVANEARAASVEYALSNSFAFGGLNAVLVLRAT
ncbi:MAG: beta-ketoacyl-[acyl-carrier-protein] synthase family protein [Bryobacteraceae bacterium]|nr:beta-ketoacyl-[acyl-carrier-protein] synthase family protein [Bryobacteraceae bacterium]